MSLPAEIRDQLLSGYLDDTLSTDERARVERLLTTDTDFARELEELRELRQSLQLVYQQDSDIRPSGGFSSRVVDAAIAHAAQENLPADHPLVRLKHQPRSTAGRFGSSRRALGVAAALAASIVIAVVAFQFGDGDGQQEGIAQRDSGVGPSETMASPIPAVGDSTPNHLALAADSAAAEDSVTPAETAEVEDLNSTNAPVDAVAESEAAESPSTRSEMRGDTATSPSPDVVANVESDGGVANTPEAGNELSIDQEMLQGGGLVTVYAVELTDLGRQQDAVGRAMRAANLTAANDQKVTDEIASYVTDRKIGAGEKNISDEVGKPEILYLQAPLKRLDRFYLNLMADEEGVKSCGLALCVDAPVVKLTRTLQVDPVQIQHQPRIFQLAADHEAVQQVASELEALPFRFDRRRQVTAPPESDGPDPVGQVLVIIR